jgi:hypothetical protein
VILGGRRNDPTSHLHLDQEQEYKDDDDIICAYNVNDDVCNTTISQPIGQLVEKGEFIEQNRKYSYPFCLRPNQVGPNDPTSGHVKASVLMP